MVAPVSIPHLRVGRLVSWSVLAALAAAGPGHSAAADRPAAPAAPAIAQPVASPEPGWPQFRGPRRDGISEEKGLLPAWPEGGPPRVWTATGLGRGFSSPIIAGGRIFVTGDFGEEVRVLALDLAGQPLWSAGNGPSWLNQYQGARASVAQAGGRVYHQSAHGRVACFEAASGRPLWTVDLLAQFGGGNITWGLSECLLVEDGVVYATAGGREALLVALDARTGEVRWRSAPLRDTGGDGEVENAGYVSPVRVDFAGRRLLIGCSLRHLYAADADTGAIQWTRRLPTSYSVLAMMPVVVGDAVFMTAPFGPPGRLYHLVAPARPGEPVGVRDGWTTQLDTCQGGVVHVGGRLYGSYYPARKGWAALDAATGEVLYEAPELVKGAPLWADGRLYALSEDGWMRLLEPTATRFEVRGQWRLPNTRGRDAWAHPVVYDGRLYVRYHDALHCHDVRASR
jgi:outer membrane protein assembly factor BamB